MRFYPNSKPTITEVVILLAFLATCVFAMMIDGGSI